VGLVELFQFADGMDRILMLLGTLNAMAHGALLPLVVIVFGNVINVFSNVYQDFNPEEDPYDAVFDKA